MSSRFQKIFNSKYPSWEEEYKFHTTCRHSEKKKCQTCILRDDDPYQFDGCKCDDYMKHDPKCWVYIVALQCYRYLENPEHKITLNHNKIISQLMMNLDTKSSKSITPINKKNETRFYFSSSFNNPFSKDFASYTSFFLFLSTLITSFSMIMFLICSIHLCLYFILPLIIAYSVGSGILSFSHTSFGLLNSNTLYSPSFSGSGIFILYIAFTILYNLCNNFKIKFLYINKIIK